MVRFEEDRLVIEIPVISRVSAVEEWQNLHAAMCDLIYFLDSERIIDGNFFNIATLMRELMPDWETAGKMVKEGE